MKTQYHDDFQYDLGYNQSYVMVIFLIALLFSAIVPLMSIFAWGYFAFKYRVDKYNLVFLYFRRFESGGSVRNLVKSFMLFNIFLYMFVMVSFYGYKFPESPYYWVGIIITILWAGAYHYIVSNSSDETVQNLLYQLNIMPEIKKTDKDDSVALLSFDEDQSDNVVVDQEQILTHLSPDATDNTK